MKLYKLIITLFFVCSMPLCLLAQNAGGNTVEMADVLHQNGKIYLVVLVLLTIFAGIILYLVRIEKKINKLEKRSNG